MDNTLVLKQDLILLHVVDPMTEMIDMIVGAADDMKVVAEAVTDVMVIGVVVAVTSVTIGGVVIDT